MITPGPSGRAPASLEPCQGTEAIGYPSVQTLTREARKVMADLDVHVSQNRLVRIIGRFVRQGRTDVDFRTWFIAYADPTGEAAVRNVMQDKGLLRAGGRSG